MNDLQTTLGIVLQVIPYREYDKILTLFTPYQGLLKLFVKGSQKTFLSQQAYATAFAKGEYLYRQSRSLSRLEEGTLLSAHLSLRNSLACLESGFQLVRAILKSQSQGKEAPKLFALFAAYLDALPRAPESLASSFFLKVLKHEGLLQKEAFCFSCKQSLLSTWRSEGECFCKIHAPPKALAFDSEEEKSLLFLTEARSISEICKFSFDQEFRAKIAELFEETLNR